MVLQDPFDEGEDSCEGRFPTWGIGEKELLGCEEVMRESISSDCDLTCFNSGWSLTSRLVTAEGSRQIAVLSVGDKGRRHT